MPAASADDDAALANLQAVGARLVCLLYRMLDEHDYSALDQVFAADASWVRLGKRTRGLDAISALLRSRPANMATRHLISNAVMTPDGADSASGTFYMMVVRRRDLPADAERPIRVPGPWRLSVLRTRFARGRAGWRIAEQHTESAFEFAPDPIPDPAGARP